MEPPATASDNSTSRRRALRLLVRLASLSAAIVLLWPTIPGGQKFLVGASPFFAIASSIAARMIGFSLAIALPLAAILLIRRRWFCRYLCPAGLLMEGCSRVGLKKSSWWAKCPPVGQYAALATLAGAILGYPLLLWLDPLSIFAAASGVFGASVWIAGLLAGAGLAILLLLTLLAGTLWCSRLCPLGGLQDMLAAIPRWLTRKPPTLDPADSLAPAPPAAMPLARRALLAGIAGAGLAWWAKRTAAANPATPLRPPGSADESRFPGLCSRCGQCVRTCPTRIIHPDLGRGGLAGLLAPRLSFDNNYCREDCVACTRVCPSGAIRPLTAADKPRAVIGLAKVDRATCILVDGGECTVCIGICPLEAVRAVFDPREYLTAPVVDAKKCNGCGACQAACPVNPVKAIRVFTARSSTS